jgi:hypothetical protein
VPKIYGKWISFTQDIYFRSTKKESAFCRAMARELRVSKATVLLVCSENEIKPHLTRVVKLSTDPDFEAKFSGCHRSLPQSSRAGSGALV